MDEPTSKNGRPLPRPVPDDRLEYVVGGAGTIQPSQLQALLRSGVVPDPVAITAGPTTAA